MRTFMKYKIFTIILIVFFPISTNWAQVSPKIVCEVFGISRELTSGGAGGQLPVTVYSSNNCVNYLILNQLPWLTYSKSGLLVTFTFQPNTGAARSGTITIGGMPVSVFQDCIRPSAAGTISGSSSVCQGQNGVQYSVSIPGAINYIWTLPSGEIITAGSSITVNYSATSLSGNISVYGQNLCGSGAASILPVIVHPYPTPSISSNSPVCHGGTLYLSTNNWSSYLWDGPNNFSSTVQNPVIYSSSYFNNTGIYHVHVQDIYGCAAQNGLYVFVNYELNALLSGGTSPICYNTSPGTFTTSASGGTGSFTYLWFKNGVSTGVSTQTYNPGSLTSTSNFYCAVSSGSCGTVNTSTATINVNPNLSVSMSGGTSPLCCNASPGTFTANGNGGTGSYNYLWYKNGASTNVTAPTYNPGPLSSTSEFYCEVTSGSCAIVRTTTIIIQVKPAISITQQPVNISITTGMNANFNLLVLHPEAFQYQWQTSLSGNEPWSNLTGPPSSGYSTNSLLIENPPIQISYYRCKIYSDCFTVYSNNVSLTVTFPPVTYLSAEEIPDPVSREINTSFQAGSINGQSSVGPDGSANYNIPIIIPPGTNGMQPSISISYNSLSGNGLLGFGGNISCLSAITRINKPYYIDGNIHGIQLDGSDLFALDGNRLVLINDILGFDGDVFKTVSETFNEIISKGTSGYGPEWFEVKMKDGTTIQYGNASNSIIKAGDGTTLIWYITRVMDIHGNYCEYKYNSDSGSQTYLEKIMYTGNTNKNLIPYNEILFSYERRSDENESYFNNLIIPLKLLLTKIECISEDQRLHSYEFKYATDVYSHLVEIIERGKNEKQLNSTIFKWGEQPSMYLTKNGSSLTPENTILYTGDFNGDGNADVITTPFKPQGAYNENDTWKLLAGSTTGYNLISQGPLNSHFVKFIVADGDDDGDDDLFMQLNQKIQVDCPPEAQILTDTTKYTNSSESQMLDLSCYIDRNTFEYYYLQDNLLVHNATKDFVYLTNSNTPQMFPSDFDGNGHIDYLFVDASNNILDFSNLSVNLVPNLNSPDKIFLLDFNGDNKVDLMTLKNGILNVLSYNLSLNSFEPLLSNYQFNMLIRGFGDFNGDGKTDILSSNSSTDLQTFINYSTGNGFKITDGPISEDLSVEEFPSEAEPPFSYVLDKNLDLIVNDFNGDGKSDIFKALFTTRSYYDHLHVHHDSITFNENVYLSIGNGFRNKHVNSGKGIHTFSQIDNNHDGNSDFIITANLDNNTVLEFFPSDKSQLICSITDGKNLKSEFNYKSLDPDVYTKETGSYTFPVFPAKIPLKIVSGLLISDNKDHSIISESLYNYTDLKMHKQGKGMLGFTKVTASNMTTGMKIVSQYAYDDTYFNSFLYKSHNFINDHELSETTNSQSFKSFDNGRYLPYLSSGVTLDVLNSTSVTNSRTLDPSGNLTQEVTGYYDASETLVKEQTNKLSEYNSFGKPRTVSTSNTRGSETITRSKSILYNTSTGLMETMTESFGSSPSVITTYQYDDFGNLVSVITTSGSKSREDIINYEPGKARFAIEKINPLGDKASFTYDAAGNILSSTDISGLTTSYQYDEFNNLKKTIFPDGRITTDILTWSFNSECTGAIFSLEQVSSNKPVSIQYYDLSGRNIRSKTQSFNGSYLITDIEYDQMGRVVNRYNPYLEGDIRSQYVHYEYDDYNRVITDTYHPNNTIVSYTYDRLKITTTKAGQTYIKEYDASGLLSESADPGGAIQYQYNASDKIKQIDSPSGSTVIDYDDYGFQRTLVDIDAGNIEYNYNAFGELKTQTDAKGIEQTFDYDNIGRMLSRSWSGGDTITYSYFSKNELIKNITSSTGVKQRFEYDNFNRLHTRIDSLNNNNKFTASYSYDNESGEMENILLNNTVSVDYGYNSYGYLRQVSTNNQTVWTATSMNQYGIVDNYTLGNQATTSISYDPYGFVSGIATSKGGNYLQNWSYSFDPATGNLMSRTGLNSSANNVTESFTYDAMNRLHTSSKGQSIDTISYDNSGHGNITLKTDVGTYNYENGVHNISSVTNPATVSQNLPAQEINYTKFNKVSYIHDLLSTPQKRELTISYGPDQQRVKSVYTIDDVTNKTKYFALGQYEKEVDANNNVRELYYISASDGVVAVLESENNQDSIFYIHKDYLGSIDVISKADGSIRQRNSFDPWGRRRNADDWSNTNVPTSFFIDRGFTGHEHLDQFGLINMNGRVYDPLLAMFLSPDNNLQLPEYTQNFNRYAYCLNNPFIYNDPTGFFVAPVYHFDFQDLSEKGSGGGTSITENGNTLGRMPVGIDIMIDEQKEIKRKEDLAKSQEGDMNTELKTILEKLKYALPVAVTWAVVGSAEGVMAGQVTPAGCGIIFRGTNRFQSIGFSSAGAGAGWVGADGSIATTYYFYTGDVNNFNRFSLNGQAWDLSISCGEGWSVGINLAVAQDRFGGYIIGIGPSAGVGASPTFFTGQYSMTLTKIWK